MQNILLSDIIYFKRIRANQGHLRTLDILTSISDNIQKHDVEVINKIIFDSMIRFKIHKLKSIKKKIKRKCRTLKKSLMQMKLEFKDYQKYNKLTLIIKKKEQKLKNKFQIPMHKEIVERAKKIVINKTNIDFEEDELVLLAKGNNYSMYNKKFSYNNLVSNLELRIQGIAINEIEKNNVRINLKKALCRKQYKPNAVQYIERNMFVKIKNKLRLNDSTVIKADKTKQLIIVKKEWLKLKLDEQVKDTEVFTQLKKNDPTEVKRNRMLEIIRALEEKKN